MHQIILLSIILSNDLSMQDVIIYCPQGVLPIFLHGGPCQQFISETQVLSHSFEEPQILSLKILRPKISLNILDYHFHKMLLNVTKFLILSLF